MFGVEADNGFKIIVTAGFSHPGAEDFLFHEAAVQESLLKIFPGKKGVCPLNVFFVCLGIFPAGLVGTDGIVVEIRPQLCKTDLLFTGQFRQALQSQLPERPPEDFGPPHDGGLQVQFLPCDAVEFAGQGIPAAKMGHQPQAGRMALKVPVSPLLALVRDAAGAVAADDLAECTDGLFIPGPVFRQKD